MLTRTNCRNGDELSALGFGCMRLPRNGGGIDESRAIAMIRRAVDGGVNYFDTAYVYNAGRSESVLGRALEGGYRDRVRIATKIPLFMVRKIDNAGKILATQLERLRTDRIDYYLLHMLVDVPSLDRLAGLGLMRRLEELKRKGTIRNIGFSFHGVKQNFELLLQAYPWDFCQIQYNYVDEHNQATVDGLRLAAKMRIPVMVMEPLRGGILANKLPPEAVAAFGACGADRTPAEWALRWVLNHPEVTVTLSGMSDEAQLEDNIRIAGEATAGALSPRELAAFESVRRVLLEKTKVPCTACGYCLPCPSGVDIPGCFAAYNAKYLFQAKNAAMNYLMHMGLASKPTIASRCVECGKCESHCPQGIPIRRELKKVRAEMEPFYFKPMLAVARALTKVK